MEKLKGTIQFALFVMALVWIGTWLLAELGVFSDESMSDHVSRLNWLYVIFFLAVSSVVWTCLGRDAADLEKRLAASDHHQCKWQQA